MFDDAKFSAWATVTKAVENGIEKNACDFAPPGQERADFIEAFQYKNREPYFHHGHLEHEQIQRWVNKPIPDVDNVVGGVKILICERHRYNLDFPIQKDTFEDVSKKFKLSPKTLQSFDCDHGTFARFYCFGKDRALNGIDVVLKAPQKREIGNYGLSMHYEINTGVTTALLFGTDISVCGKDHNSPLTPSTSGSSTLPVFDEKTKSPWIRFPSEGTLTQFRRPELITMLESVLHSLRHPLLLPCLILEDHMRRTQNLCEHKQVFQETWQIMHKLGLRGDDRSQELFWIEAMAHTNAYSKQKADERFDAKLLTARMDRQVLRIMYTERSPQWNYKCSAFLLDFLNNLDVRQPSLDFDFVMNETLRDGLESNMSMAESLSSRLATMKESMMLQLEVLASIVSQSSNEWSANISWESARDSTSMKILALITAFFLPATFVATVFGMSMFDWMWADDPSGPSSGGGGGGGGGNSNNNNSNNTEPGVVSHRFWIYVAFAVPLTLFTLAGWIGWWAFEMHLRRQKEQNRQRRTLSRRIDEQFENLDQEVKGWKKRSGLRTATTAIKVEKDSKSLV